MWQDYFLYLHWSLSVGRAGLLSLAALKSPYCHLGLFSMVALESYCWIRLFSMVALTSHHCILIEVSLAELRIENRTLVDENEEEYTACSI